MELHVKLLRRDLQESFFSKLRSVLAFGILFYLQYTQALRHDGNKGVKAPCVRHKHLIVLLLQNLQAVAVKASSVVLVSVSI